jgi:hypothetical protein
LLRQLNEKQRLVFDDVMHRKQLYLDILTRLFFTKGAGIGKTFTIKFIIQGLL